MSDGAAEDRHVQTLDLSIVEGGDGWRGEDAARAGLRSERLRSVVREHIVPRLALLHRDWKSQRRIDPPTVEDIEAFGAAILGSDNAVVEQLFERLRDRGLTSDELFETLLAPTARRLGELWNEDIVDFVEVTMGVNRLRILLEAYTRAPARAGDPRRRALLIATPLENHHFGLDVVASFLRSSGWDAVMEAGRTPRDNAEVVSESWFAVAGLTVSVEANLGAAARAIEAIRRASLNPALAVIVGGWALHGRPDLVARIGGDATADDGPSAVLLAEKLYISQGAAPRMRA